MPLEKKHRITKESTEPTNNREYTLDFVKTRMDGTLVVRSSNDTWFCITVRNGAQEGGGLASPEQRGYEMPASDA